MSSQGGLAVQVTLLAGGPIINNAVSSTTTMSININVILNEN